MMQSSIVVAGGFVASLWVLSGYPTALAMGFGVVLYGEKVTLAILLAATLVGGGLVLINRTGMTATRLWIF